jgi:hypothetical protein
MVRQPANGPDEDSSDPELHRKVDAPRWSSGEADAGDLAGDGARGDSGWESGLAPWESAETLVGEGEVDAEAGGIAANGVEVVCADFVGRWNRLVSYTNWEKGRIISQWRSAMIESGAPVSDYADEVWARRVGGVTAAHVGRLRRVHDKFHATQATYPGLSWTHFLAAIDWDDSPMWLEGAVQSRWSVAAMRRQRWEVMGGDEATRPDDGESLAPPWDEDYVAAQGSAAGVAAGGAKPSTQPAQGGGSTKRWDEGPDGITVGPAYESPDFGEEESLNRAGVARPSAAGEAPFAEEAFADGSGRQALPQPFAGLAKLPDDLAEAMELLKLAVLRHKSAGWKETTPEIIQQYLQAFRVLIEADNR